MTEPVPLPPDTREILVLLTDRDLRRRVTAALERRQYRVPRPERLADWVHSRRPHVLLVTDDGEPAGRAREVVARIAPEAAYVVLVESPTPETYRRLVATCSAVLPASSADDDVVLAVAGAWRDLTCLPTPAARSLTRPAGGPDGVTLSDREAGWLRALAEGTTVARLARASGYSQREMYRLLASVYARLGTDNRTEALLQADRAGLLDARPTARSDPARPGRDAARSTSGAR